MTVLRTASGRATPIGREEMEVCSRQVSSTRLEEIRDVLELGDSGMMCCHQFLDVGWAAAVLAFANAHILRLT
jgi:hypothetical protein